MADTDHRQRDEAATPGRGGRTEPSHASGGSAGVHSPEASGPEEFDRDVNIKAVIWTGAILAGVTVLSFILMWWLFQALVAGHERRDPEPSPIREAAEPTVPPGPVLQTEPEEDLRRMRAMEEYRLSGYGMAEGEEGYARVPIEVALEMALERGLGEGAEDAPGRASDAPDEEVGAEAGGGMSAEGDAVAQPDAEGTPAEPTEEQSSQ